MTNRFVELLEMAEEEVLERATEKQNSPRDYMVETTPKLYKDWLSNADRVRHYEGDDEFGYAICGGYTLVRVIDDMSVKDGYKIVER
jgi:hypothetical protein